VPLHRAGASADDYNVARQIPTEPALITTSDDPAVCRRFEQA
jgi:hypothetical protein